MAEGAGFMGCTAAGHQGATGTFWEHSAVSAGTAGAETSGSEGRPT